MEMEEIVRMSIFIVILIIMVGAVIMFSDKGGQILDSIRNLLRFGR